MDLSCYDDLLNFGFARYAQLMITLGLVCGALFLKTPRGRHISALTCLIGLWLFTFLSMGIGYYFVRSGAGNAVDATQAEVFLAHGYCIISQDLLLPILATVITPVLLLKK